MNDHKKTATATRIVSAPTGTGPNKPGTLLSVELEADQAVEWIWTHYANGTSAVTGYRTVLRTTEPA